MSEALGRRRWRCVGCGDWKGVEEEVKMDIGEEMGSEVEVSLVARWK